MTEIDDTAPVPTPNPEPVGEALLLPLEDAQRIASYLARCPYAEVRDLFGLIEGAQVVPAFA